MTTIRIAMCILLLSFETSFLHAEDSAQTDSIPTKIYHVSGSALVTNNGISLLPMFNLGKPAAIFDLSVGNERLAFEQQLRFSLEGKPWSFIFWTRYKAVTAKRFRLNIGGNTSVAFRNSFVYDKNGVAKEALTPQQFIATEIIPNFQLTKNFAVGAYYLVSHGLTEGANKWTNFITLNATITNIPVGKETFLRIYPQVYFLDIDYVEGFYTTATFTLTNKNIPFTLSSIINRKLKSDIVSKDFIWNIQLAYTFNKRFKRI
jgi:hypothetical protein